MNNARKVRYALNELVTAITAGTYGLMEQQDEMDDFEKDLKKAVNPLLKGDSHGTTE